MILTITPNPAVDLTWQVDSLAPGQTHRVPTGVSRAGGKGLNVARVLHGRGAEVTVVAPIGGPSAEQFSADLQSAGLRHRLLPVAGATRRTVAIHDESAASTTLLTERGAGLDQAEVLAFLDLARSMADHAATVVISGSLPPGLEPDQLADLIRGLSPMPVVADLTGPALLRAAQAGALAVKPNRDELRATTGLADPVAGAGALLRAGARLVVVSLGSEGMVLASADAPTALVRARLRRTVRGNATGAGDAAVAAIATFLAERDPHAPITADELTTLATTATAWSASAVLMPLAGDLSPEVEALTDDVVVTTHLVASHLLDPS